MPILRVDQFGKLYESSPDREDGGGVGREVECVTQGDLTLGAAYLKSQSRQQQDLLKLRRDQKFLDAEDQMTARIAKQDMLKRAKKAKAQAVMQEDPRMKEAVLRKAIGMGCPCDYSTPMSGNVMTYNGQSGRAGMNRNDRILHDVAFGRESAAHRADPSELEQHKHKLQADRLLRLRAKR